MLTSDSTAVDAMVLAPAEVEVEVKALGSKVGGGVENTEEKSWLKVGIAGAAA